MKQKPERWLAENVDYTNETLCQLADALETISAQLDYIIEQNGKPEHICPKCGNDLELHSTSYRAGEMEWDWICPKCGCVDRKEQPHD